MSLCTSGIISLILLFNYSIFSHKDYIQEHDIKFEHRTRSYSTVKGITNPFAIQGIGRAHHQTELRKQNINDMPLSNIFVATENLLPKSNEDVRLSSNRPIYNHQNNKAITKISLEVLVILIICGAGYIVYSYQGKRKERKRFWAVIKRIKKEKETYIQQSVTTHHSSVANTDTSVTAQKVAIDENSEKTTKNDTEKRLSILKETEDKILRQLDKLEKGTSYTQNNMSLSSLATKLKTNAKYLSYVINNYKKKDFNNYINDLRIEYIIDKITNDREYIDYKISYLAKECGFSSHSKFSAAFKKVTGLTPSTFINQQQKNNTQER